MSSHLLNTKKYVRLTLYYFKRNLFQVEKVAEDFYGIFDPKKLLSPLGNVIRDVHPGSGSGFFTRPGFRGQKAPDPDPQHWICQERRISSSLLSHLSSLSLTFFCL